MIRSLITAAALVLSASTGAAGEDAPEFPEWMTGAWAHTDGENATRFVAVHADGDDVIFENAANDYPQRVRYWRDSKEMKARISILDGSKPMDFSWRMMGGN